VFAGDRFFVKTAGDPATHEPYLGFADRVALLRNAADLARSVTHPALPVLHRVVESPTGPLLVLEWREGDLLAANRGSHQARNAHERFRALSSEEILAALDTVYDLHRALDSAGWIEGDFYDGSLMYDFDARR